MPPFVHYDIEEVFSAPSTRHARLAPCLDLIVQSGDCLQFFPSLSLPAWPHARVIGLGLTPTWGCGPKFFYSLAWESAWACMVPKG